MKRWSLLVVAVMVVAITAMWTSNGFSQARRGGPGGPGGPGGFDPAEFRQRMEERMKDRLGATDDEWAVLQPRLRKVQDLRAGGMRGMGRFLFGGRGGRGGPGGPPPLPGDTPDSVRKVVEASERLGDLVEQDAAAEDLKAALDTLRGAKREQQQALDKAQQELREVLTLKQEAMMVMMNMID